MNNGVSLNSDTIKSILLTIYENKPDFPIDAKDVLIEALGGKDQFYFINEKMGELPASALAEKSFETTDNFENPNQVIDAIIGESFVNIFTKAKLLDKISKLNYPIESKDIFTKETKDLIIYGIPIDVVANKLDYPISKPDQIINRIKLIDQKLIDANLELILDIRTKEIAPKEGEALSKGPVAGPTQLLKLSESYLIKEEKPTICFEIFNQAESSKFKCLCISRTHPQQLREKYNMNPDKLLWLTDSDSTKEEIIGPTLESLMFQIEEFIKNNPKSILVLDGLEYLISKNDFNPVLNFARQLKDKVSESQTITILPISPGAIDEKQVKLIERELEVLDTEAEINLPDLGVKEVSESEELSLKEKIKKIIELGKDAYRKKEYQRAIEIYDEGLELDYDNTELRFLKKTVQAKIDDLTKGKTGEDVGAPVEPEQPTQVSSETAAVEVASTDTTASETVSTETPGSESRAIESTSEAPNSSSKMFDASTLDASVKELAVSGNKIEQLEKRLQEKVKVLQDLSGPGKELPKDACNSCEGTGECYWCKGSNKCNSCSGTGKNEAGEKCSECDGKGNCHSCNGSGKCRWCEGTGKKSK